MITTVSPVTIQNCCGAVSYTPCGAQPSRDWLGNYKLAPANPFPSGKQQFVLSVGLFLSFSKGTALSEQSQTQKGKYYKYSKYCIHLCVESFFKKCFDFKLKSQWARIN